MKISPATLDTLRVMIAPLDSEDTRDGYRTGRYGGGAKDLDKRYRWDLFYAAKCWRLPELKHVTDAHIDTALRRIVAPLGE